MAKIKLKSASLSSDPEVKVPKFYFMPYSKGMTVTNNEEEIDFVTDGKSLYVCAVENAVLNGDDIDKNSSYLLKIVSQGEKGEKGTPGIDGAAGVVPEIGAEYIDIGDEKKLALTVGGKRKAMTGDLTPPVYVPTLVNDRYLTWEWNGDEPATIDLMKLRPINERPILLRTNSDNTKLDAEVSGPANFIQWKYEGDEYWTNLISIQELMNLAFAGMCTWEAADGKWHFGYKEVVKATYDSTKSGRRIINRVELGQILFDAGEIPLQDNEVRIKLIEAQLEELKNGVQSISIDGGRKLTPDRDGNVNLDLSDYVKSVNGVRPVDGNVTIDVGNNQVFDIRVNNNNVLQKSTNNGTSWTDVFDLKTLDTGTSGSGITEAEVKTLIGKILEGVLDSAIPEYKKGSDHNYFIRLDDLSDYAKLDVVAGMIRDAMTGQDMDYYRVFTLYQRTSSGSTVPSKPVKGVWNWNTTDDELSLKPNKTSNWNNHPDNASVATPYLWMSTATYSHLTKSEVGDWETPVCLTGEAGQNGQVGRDGVDGDSIEFAYILCTQDEWNNVVKSATLQPTRGDNTKDDLPRNLTGVSHSWLDHPSGISPEYPIEAVTIRTKDNGTWSNYSNATIWSMWGEDGIDGDGVEYIFFIASANDVNTASDGKIILKQSVYSKVGNFIPTTIQEVEELGNSYQVPDWISVADNNWTDNPSDVDPQQPYEFVAIRKYRYDKDEKSGSWGPFSTPTLWAHYGGVNIYPKETVYGESNYRPYRCFCFYRAAENDNTDYSKYRVEYDFTAFATSEKPNPTYSDLTDNQKQLFYDNPQNYTKTLNASSQVVSITWEDTVPVGNGTLWMITAHIGDEAQASDTGWTSPVIFMDSEGIELEYAVESNVSTNVYNNPSLWNSHNLTLNDFTGTNSERVVKWRTAVNNAGYGVWGEGIQDPTYVAISVKLENGSWSNWEIYKIKGEKGEKGDQGEPGSDGNGVEFVFFALTAEQYNNRTNFIDNSNKFYVYDDIEHLGKSYNQSEYLPYTKIADGTSDKLWASDTNPGITKDRPYVFVSVRHQIGGLWTRQYTIPGGITTTFGPASLWLAGDVIDYAESTVNVSDDTIQIRIDPETKYPTSTIFTSDTHSIQFYHGTKALYVDEVRVLINETWELLAKVGESNSVQTYELNTSYGKIGCSLSVNEYGEPKVFEVKVKPLTEIAFTEQLLKLKFYSKNEFIDESGIRSRYVADLNIKLLPTELNRNFVLNNQRESLIKKSSEDALTYDTSLSGYWVLGTDEGLSSPNNRLMGLESIPGDYSKWKLSVEFDGTPYCTNSSIAQIYRDWVINVKTDNDSTNNDANYKSDGTRCTYNEYPVVINCYKTFYGDGHYFHDFVIISLNLNKYNIPIKDKVVGKLYYDGNLIDEQTIPIVYNGKNGTSFEIDNTPVATANVSDNGIVFNDETNTSIAELNIEHLNDFENAVDENVFTNISNMVQVDSTSGSYIGLKDVASFAVHPDEFITVTNNNGNVNVSLNYAALVQSLRDTLFGGNTPLVQTIQINDLTGSNDPLLNNNGGLFINQGLTIQTAGLESITSEGEDTFNVDTTNNVATVNSVTAPFIVNTNTGSSYIDVGANANRAPKAPSIMAAARVISGYENVYPSSNPQQQLYDEAGYHTLRMYLAGSHNDSNVTYTLHLSKPVYIYTIEGSDAESLSEYTSDYNYLFSGKHDEITIVNNSNSEYNVAPEICISFKDIKPNTLISAYMTAQVETDGETVDYRSATVYFRSTEYSE